MPIPAPFTDQQIADQITRDGMHWDGDNIIYYAFPSSLGSWSGAAVNEFGLSATQRVWVELVFEQLEELFDLDFIRTTVPNNPDSSDIIDTIRLVNDAGNGTYSQSWSYSDGGIAINNIVFDSTWSSNQDANLSYGSYGFMTMIHEILHSLGLEHPGDYNAGSGGPITYQNSAEFEQDTHRYTVMSYFSSYEDGSGAIFYDTTTGSFVYPRTPMVYDILAMTTGAFSGQFAGYGENSTTRNTDTTYGYNATSGINDAFDFDAHGAPVLTIYDTGGIDTLDLSGDTVSVAAFINYDGGLNPTGISTQTRTETLIDLREGAYSSTHGMQYNLAIAFGTVIENAIGTQFNDTVHGNSVANTLDGRGGNDTMYGYAGDDTLLGRAGADVLFGGNGNDYLDGGSGADRLMGGNNDDIIVYDAADDWAGGDVNGGDGFDTLLFELVWYSVDLLAYGFEQSALHLIDVALELWAEVYHYYNVAEELFESTYLNDDGTTTNVVYDVNNEHSWDEWHRTYDTDGNLISEEFVGGSTNPVNTINGTAGDDSLVATSDPDEIDGDTGVDWISYEGSSAPIDVRLYAGTGSGGHAAGDTLVSIENVSGSAYADLIMGNGADNTLVGNAGNDDLQGRNGNDHLIGGDGNDILRGHNHSDILEGGAGNDTLNGGNGDDRLIGGMGDDTLNGGSGTDWAEYDDSASGVNINLVSGTGTGGDAEGDTLVSVENVSGSQFADDITGNAGNNVLDGNDGDDVLRGGAGNDTLNGGTGDDRLIGGAGADSLNGGSGSDWAEYDGSTGAVDVRLYAGTGSGGHAAGDTLTGVEHVSGSDYADRLHGNGADNTLVGNAGNDDLQGRNGDDHLIGGDGNDMLRGHNHSDILEGGAGNDTLNGGNGDDRLIGGAGADSLNGGSGSDWAEYDGSTGAVDVRLYAGTGSGGHAAGDTITGVEHVSGSAYSDLIMGNGADNTLVGNDGNDDLQGRNGDDHLIGGDGNDILRGHNHSDILEGGAGNDTLNGGNGDDRLIGGIGNDIYNGGSGSDTFVFEFGDGDDVIRGFEDGLDLIDIQGADFASLTIYADGSDAVIEYGSDTIRLENFDASLIDADDFVV